MSVNPTEASSSGQKRDIKTDYKGADDYKELEVRHDELKDELTTVRRPNNNSDNSNEEVDKIEESLEENPLKETVMEEIRDVLGRMGLIKPEAEKPKPSLLKTTD